VEKPLSRRSARFHTKANITAPQRGPSGVHPVGGSKNPLDRGVAVGTQWHTDRTGIAGEVGVHRGHDVCSVQTMRRILPALAMFALGCGGSAHSNDSAQVPRDAALSGSDSGFKAQPSANTPADASLDVSTAPSRRICDGSDGIRLAYWVGGGGQQAAYTAVLHELGYEFLYVDGHCHYWVRDPGGSPGPPNPDLLPFREGDLTSAQESILHDLVSYDDFARSAPACPPANSGVFDASTAVLWDGVKRHDCYAGWHVDAAWPMRSELFSSGSPMTGPMRVEVGQDSVADSATIYPWPLIAPIAGYEVPVAKSWSAGQSVLVSDPTDAGALRHLRDQAVANTNYPQSSQSTICVQPRGYVMAMREDLPFTRRSDGLWVPQ
jgi:hypothetical protein